MLLVIDTTQEHDYRPLLSRTEEAYDGRRQGEERHVFLAVGKTRGGEYDNHVARKEHLIVLWKRT